MDKKNTYVIAGVVGLALIAVGFVYVMRSTITIPSEDQTSESSEWANKPAEPKSPAEVKTMMTINAKHAFRNGQHIVVGEVGLPTPCHILESQAIVDADKKSALIDLTASQKTDEVCAQVITTARFKVVFTASKDAKIIARYNGQDATLNLIEAAPGEDLDKAEIYIKG